MSELQFDSPLRDDFEWMVGKCREAGGIFIFSQAHVEECKSSSRPEEFAQILESLGAYFIRDWHDVQSEQILEAGRARELILPQPEATDALAYRFFDSIKILNFAIGGLASLEADQLLQDIATDLESAWSEMSVDIPSMSLPAFDAKRNEAINLVRAFPAQQFRNEMAPWKEAFRGKLPTNLAQLDQVPSEKVIDDMVGLLVFTT